MIQYPSYRCGYASPRRGLLRYPGLWSQCFGAFCPSLGATGDILYDHSAWAIPGSLLNMDKATDWVISESGMALDFDGSTADVRATYNYRRQQTLIWSGSLSVSAWVYPRTNYGPVVRCQNTSNQTAANGLFVDITSAGKVTLGWNTSAAVVTGAVTVPLNKWSHICAVRYIRTGTTTVAQVHVNGMFDATANSTHSVSGNTQTNVNIGSSGSATGSFNGLIDDVRLYHRPLFRWEIAMLATQRGIAFTPADIDYRPGSSITRRRQPIQFMRGAV